MATVDIGTPLLGALALGEGEETTWTGTTPFIGSSFNIMAITVGVGLLSIPNGVAAAGWVGILYILLLGFMATTSGVMLVRSMEATTARTNRPERRQYYSGCVTYSCVGHAAMGSFGEVFVMLQVHMTLVGASVIFLILAGSFVHDLLTYLPSQYHLEVQITTLICGCIASFHSVFKTLRELGFMSAFNVMVSLYLFGVIFLEVLSGHRPHHVQHDVARFNLDTIAAFSNFAYAFASHPCIPTIYNSMAKPSTFPRMLLFSVCCIGSFYALIGLVGYWGFGSGVGSPVIDSLNKSNWKATAQLAFVMHVLMSFGLVVNAPEASLDRELNRFMRWWSGGGISESTDSSEERTIGNNNSVVPSPCSEQSESSCLSQSEDGLPHTQPFSWILHLTVRLGLTAAVTGTAVFFSTKPDAFKNVLNLVSSVTNTFTIFLLPAIFYAILVLPDIESWHQRVGISIWICVLVVIGLACSAIGSYTAIKKLFF